MRLKAQAQARTGKVDTHLHGADNVTVQHVARGAHEQVHGLHHIQEDFVLAVLDVLRSHGAVCMAAGVALAAGQGSITSERHETALVTAMGGRGAASSLRPVWVMNSCQHTNRAGVMVRAGRYGLRLA